MRAGEIIEWVLILLAIGALWLPILGYHALWSQALLAAALAAMILVFVRRLGRVRRAR